MKNLSALFTTALRILYTLMVAMAAVFGEYVLIKGLRNDIIFVFGSKVLQAAACVLIVPIYLLTCYALAKKYPIKSTPLNILCWVFALVAAPLSVLFKLI
ncbi:hypothetical protein [uncultured Ruminococcus sp.]|uniref:hypothetical protein n=1 Tax=uncultured Ruminococcus sp. TaxID=165186 RepID=UPI0025D5F537|nr:hypothetical protein [uncultured Ruminococcus sp.]